MKRLTLPLLTLLFSIALSVSAATPSYENQLTEIVTNIQKTCPNFSLIPIDEGALDWETYKDKKKSVTIDKNMLSIVNKAQIFPLITHVDLPINTEEDFVIFTMVTVKKLDKSSCCEFVMDWIDEQNFSAIVINSQSAKYARIRDGKISVEESAFVNLAKGKNCPVCLLVEKRNNTFYFSVNGDQCISVSAPEYVSPGFGYSVPFDQQVTVVAIGCGDNNNED